MSLSFRRWSLLALLALLAAFAPLARPALAAPFPVTSLADSGAGTLRAAIASANSTPGNDTITFNLTGTPQPWVIALNSVLPALTDQAGVTIDGVVGGVPTIEIQGGGTLPGQGILIQSSNNVIRGLIINGFVDLISLDFRGAGIVISGYGSITVNSNTVELCYLGTNHTGDGFPLGLVGPAGNNNFNAGLIVEYGASNTTVRNNVISGNFQYGVYLVGNSSLIAQNNTIINNKIGVNKNGTAALSNGRHGVYISTGSNNNTVGGPNPTDRNVISGNGANRSSALYGVFISDTTFGTGQMTGNRVIGNYIGTDVTGMSPIPNTSQLGVGGGGVGVGQSTNTTVGGPNPGDRNVISGNEEYGVAVVDTTTGTTIGTNNISIQNNLIGVAANGTTPLANTQGGVILRSKASGVTVGPNNVIGGNAFYGVRIDGALNIAEQNRQTRNNTISSNFIGTDASGTLNLANGAEGVQIRGNTSGNTITNNRIANNSFAGVQLRVDNSSPTTYVPSLNTISSNTISNNGTNGVELLNGTTGNVVGLNNTISGHNNGAGVLIQSPQNTVKGNTISSNQIGINITGGGTGNTIGGTAPGEGNSLTGNALYGVFVTGSGVVNNRITRTTTSNNGNKGIGLASGGNAPIAGATLSVNQPVSGFTLTGSVTGCTGSCTVEIFTDNSPLTDFEGPNYLTSAPVASGSFTADITGCKPYLIFTVTDGAGNTSEFLNPIGQLSQCVAAAPAVTITTDPPVPPQTIPAGTSITYVHHVENSGNGAGAVSLSFTQTPNTWASLINNTCLGQNLGPGGTCGFSVKVDVPANALASEFNQATINVNIGSATGQQVDRTNVTPVVGATFTPSPVIGPQITPPATAVYTHTLTNTGNSPDTFTLTGTTDAPDPGVTFNFSPPSPITLAPGQSQVVQVMVNIPSGATQAVVVTHVTATSQNDPNTHPSVTQNTPIQLAPVPQLTPPSQPGSGRPGTSVTFLHTLKNVGTQQGDFSLALSGLPGGWTHTISPTNPITLAPNESKAITLTVNIPLGADAGTLDPLTLTATVSGNTATDAAQDILTVLLAPALEFTPLTQNKTAGPGQTITYTHTLTNTGNGQDTFSITVTPPASPPGWSFSVQPPGNITLAKNASRAITLSLTLPQGIAASPLPYTTTVTARSTTDPNVSKTVTDTVTVVAAPVPILSPAQSKSTNPGVVITFTHTITNVGNADGTFNLTIEGLPAGWSVAPIAPVTLNQGASTTFDVVVTPSSTATAGDYSFTIRATAQTGTFATTTVTDQVTINRVAGLRWSPDQITDPTQRPPGSVVSYTLTLSNTGNFADNISLAVSTSRGWGVRTIPASTVQLGPGASAPIQVELTIPPGQEVDPPNTTVVTATSSLSPPLVQASARITTTLAAVPGVTLLPESQSLTTKAGQPVTFTFTLQNSGSISQTYTITRTNVPNVPSNWSAVLTPTTTAALAPGQSILVQLVVTAPANTPDGVYPPISVTARSNTAPNPSDTAFAHVRIGPPFGVIVDPDRHKSAVPGALVQYTEFVTNTGLLSDTFLLSVLSPLGWDTAVTPPSVLLAPGASRQVTVTVAIPTSAEAGLEHHGVVIARSTSQLNIMDMADIKATVLQVAGVSISPSRVAATDPGKLIRFQHTLINTGNGADHFLISATQERNWTITIVPTQTVVLGRGVSFPVEVQVQVPAGTPVTTSNRITVRATSAFAPSVFDQLIDVVGAQFVQETHRKIYMPLVLR